MEVSKSIFKRQADFLEKNGKYLLQFTLIVAIINKIRYIFIYQNTKLWRLLWVIMEKKLMKKI